MEAILRSIRQDLQDSADEQTKATSHRFFKEEVLVYGVKSAVVIKIARRHWKEISYLDKNEIFALCEDLLSSDIVKKPLWSQIGFLTLLINL
jgi:3-methyladenine DNA glycosylase AlkD